MAIIRPRLRPITNGATRRRPRSRIRGEATAAYPAISDDEIRRDDGEEPAPAAAERGADMTIFRPAPRPWPTMSATKRSARPGRGRNNDLISAWSPLSRKLRRCLHAAADRPGRDLAGSIAELERCVTELGFVGMQPQPRSRRGGHCTGPPLTDRFWYPFYEKMVELDVPAMIHVSRELQSRTSTPPALTTSTPTPEPSCS